MKATTDPVERKVSQRGPAIAHSSYSQKFNSPLRMRGGSKFSGMILLLPM